MMCFKDKAFCSAKCNTTSCSRNFTEKLRKESREWWSHDPINAPVAFMDFRDGCEWYEPVNGETK